jgi:predicted nucleotidyltransferase
MRDQFGQEYIGGEFDRIGNALSEPLKFFLIGGGSMALRDLKDATKDIDVIVRTSSDFEQLRSVLKRLNYESIREPGDEYAELGAQTILENEDGCRFDIFNKQVIDKLILSSGMQDRCQLMDTSGYLTVKAMSLEDIFLFKSVAGRTTDIEDMDTLVQTGLDFDTILEELRVQSELLDEEFFATFVNEALIDLEDRFGVTTPFHDPVREITARVYDQLALLQTFNDTIAVEELQQESELPKDRFSAMLEGLEQKGNIKREDDTIRKIDNKP